MFTLDTLIKFHNTILDHLHGGNNDTEEKIVARMKRRLGKLDEKWSEITRERVGLVSAIQALDNKQYIGRCFEVNSFLQVNSYEKVNGYVKVCNVDEVGNLHCLFTGRNEGDQLVFLSDIVLESRFLGTEIQNDTFTGLLDDRMEEILILSSRGTTRRKVYEEDRNV